LIVVHNDTYYLRGIVSASLNGPLNGCNLKAYSIFTDILEFAGWIMEGKDDKTLIQYLYEKIRKLEQQNDQLKKMKSLKLINDVELGKENIEFVAQTLKLEPEEWEKQTRVESWRYIVYFRTTFLRNVTDL